MIGGNSSIFLFTDAEVREREFSLIKAGEVLPVEPKAFRVLLILLRNPQKLITKEELLSAVWGDAAVTENSLARSIALLRRLLGDDIRNPQFIETVTTVGYRFVCPVEVVENPPGVSAAPRSAAAGEAGCATASDHDRFRSLAVLPFLNGAGPQEAEYLSEGISESIINLLSQFPDLRVVPRTSAFRFKGLETDLKRVGRDLNVDVVLTGTVVQRGDRLIVQTELVDVVNDAQLWGGKYNRKLEDIFELQEELARRISESLRPRLTPDEEKFLTRRPTENREAYHLYLKAMYFANKWTPDGIQQGIVYSRQAIEMDPLFARAYTGLAYLYMLVSSFGSIPPIQAFSLAKAATLRALEIDDALATAHAFLAYMLLAHDWDWIGAEKESRRAVELAPHLPEGHYVRSQWCLVNGRSNEAIAEARRAMELDPLSLPNHQNLAMTYHMLGKFDAAIEQLQKALELDSSFSTARQQLALCYAQTGRYEEAFAEADKAALLSGATSRADIRVRGVRGVISALAGRYSEARADLAELSQYAKDPDFVSALDCAYIHAFLGEKDQALDWYDKAFRGRAPTLFYIRMRMGPIFEILHTNPRFGDLLRRMGVPE